MPSVKKGLRRAFNLEARSLSFKRYLRLLRTVCQIHATEPWSAPLLTILRKKEITSVDVQSMFQLADSLSQQKYSDPVIHYRANQISLLIRKYPFPKRVNPFTPEIEAMRSFLKSEARCARMNKYLRLRRIHLRDGRLSSAVLNRCRAFIQYVLGPAPTIEQVFDHADFGPGAAVGVPSASTNIYRKINAKRWTVTPGAYMYSLWALSNHSQLSGLFPELMPTFVGPPALKNLKKVFDSKVRIVAYNKLAFVPKTAKTHRSIAVEPLLNGYLQKGVDVIMRARLKRVALDLTSQEGNQELARLGSFHSGNTFCTIDLSSASDSVSTELVRELLPPDWFELMNSLRSKEFSYKGVQTRYEKFSSMGNGFNFPLQTLLYASVCYASKAGQPGKDFLVYGDDIIVRKSVFADVSSLLRRVGFQLNTRKTFNQGPFRESCGADWFGGVDVRPYTLDNPLDSLERMFEFLNSIKSKEIWKDFFGDVVYKQVLAYIPISLQYWRPFVGPSDTGLDSYGDEFLTSPSCKYRRPKGGGTKRWFWKESLPCPVVDSDINLRSQGGRVAHVYAALRSGSIPRSEDDELFTSRVNIARRRMRIISHAGATSQWLPLNNMMELRGLRYILWVNHRV